MMAGRIALCIDEAAARNPELIGLDGERVADQEWLDVFTRGDEARTGIGRTRDTTEVWVVSCDDVEPINLAATIKADMPELNVRLVANELCGSLFSRAHNAQIDEVIELSAFIRRYASAKASFSNHASTNAQGESEGALPPPPDAGGTVEPGEAVVDGRVRADASAVVVQPVLEATQAVAQEESSAPATASVVQRYPQSQVIMPRAASRAFVMSVVSGSGGAGKSSVSALGAEVARRSGQRTLLLDCDLQFGDVDVMVGVENPLRIDVALAHPDDLEMMIGRNEPLSVLAAPSRLEAAESVVQQLSPLLDRLSEEFDVIVVNTGASWAEQHAVLLERSSVALFLIDQRASSVRACKHALELCARCGIASNPFQFALNRCAKGAPLTSVDVSCALQGAPVFELKDGGLDVEEYLSGGGAAELVDARNEFARSVAQAMSRLLPGDVVEASAFASAEAPRRRSSRRRMRHRR